MGDREVKGLELKDNVDGGIEWEGEGLSVGVGRRVKRSEKEQRSKERGEGKWKILGVEWVKGEVVR